MLIFLLLINIPQETPSLVTCDNQILTWLEKIFGGMQKSKKIN